ncbi:unnamed protein product [Malus baccata var. baccata]
MHFILPAFLFFPPNQIPAAADFGDARLPRDPELPRSSSPPWIRFGDANSPSQSEGVEAERNRRTFQNSDGYRTREQLAGKLFLFFFSLILQFTDICMYVCMCVCMLCMYVCICVLYR